MTAKEIKKVVQDTEKELEQKKQEQQIAKIKEVVKKTLEALEKCKTDKDEIEKRIKYLRMDLEDLKEGKLDRIEERQAKDPDAKVNSVIIIIKEKETIIERERSPWYWPYTITVQQPYWYNPVWCGNTIATNLNNTLHTSYGDSISSLTYNASSGTTNTSAIAVNCSLAKDYSAGAYDINGKVINFR